MLFLVTGCSKTSASVEDTQSQDQVGTPDVVTDLSTDDRSASEVVGVDQSEPEEVDDVQPGDLALGEDAVTSDSLATDSALIDQGEPDLAADGESADGQEVITAPLVVADSEKQFSSVQGQDGWYYGYWDLSADLIAGDGVYQTSEFVPLPEWFADWECWMVNSADDGFWTLVGATQMHPNGLSGWDGRQKARHWAIRRWISDVSGALRIEGLAHKREGAITFDGVGVRVLIDGVEKWMKSIAGDDTVGVALDLCVDVSVGSIIDFAVDDGGNGDDGDDTTVYTVTISTVPAGCQ